MGHDGPPLSSDPFSFGDSFRGWIQGDLKNLGVALVGFDEGVGGEDESDCQSKLTNIALKVTVFWETPSVEKPELIVRDVVFADQTQQPGCLTGVVNVGVMTENAGSVPITNLRLALSVDGQYRRMTFAADLRPAEIAAHQFDDVELSAGKHTIEVVGDPEGLMAEVSEGNNVARADVVCAADPAPKPAAAPASLRISTFELVPAANGAVCVAGGGHGIHLVVENPGDSDVGSPINVQVNVDGKPGGSTSIGGVSSKSEKDSFVSNVEIPAGNHTVSAKVDFQKLVANTGEGNNSKSLTVNCARP
jgi:hypothetical protein